MSEKKTVKLTKSQVGGKYIMVVINSDCTDVDFITNIKDKKICAEVLKGSIKLLKELI